MRGPRSSNGTPSDSYSERCQPTPTPSRTRPLERTSRVATCFATRAGWRCGRTKIPVPSLMRWVTAEIAPSCDQRLQQLGRGLSGLGSARDRVPDRHVLEQVDLVVAGVFNRACQREDSLRSPALGRERELDRDVHRHPPLQVQEWSRTGTTIVQGSSLARRSRSRHRPPCRHTAAVRPRRPRLAAASGGRSRAAPDAAPRGRPRAHSLEYGPSVLPPDATTACLATSTPPSPSAGTRRPRWSRLS